MMSPNSGQPHPTAAIIKIIAAKLIEGDERWVNAALTRLRRGRERAATGRPEDASDRPVPTVLHAKVAARVSGLSKVDVTPGELTTARTRPPAPAAAGWSPDRHPSVGIPVPCAACGCRENLLLNLLLHLRAHAVALFHGWTASPGYHPRDARHRLRRGEWIARSAFRLRRSICDRAEQREKPRCQRAPHVRCGRCDGHSHRRGAGHQN